MDIHPTERLTMRSMSLANPSDLAIPSTQNTAPVHCFRCLYTYDLRRKAKRWQDGAVRFHTFNKRIMVYDVSRNFVGDTHWRDGGVIEDGDELELDKGVLIQVGEKTESVDQDLTSILERRGKNHIKSAENDVESLVVPDLPSVGYPGLSSPSQLRPKSLNAILGTPSGPLGRTAQLSKSPCELRLQKEYDMVMQRDAKRRRIERASKTGSALSTTQDPAKTSRTENTIGDAVSGRAKAANEGDLLRQASTSTARTRIFQVAPMTAATTAPQTSKGCITEECVSDEAAGPVPCSNPTYLPRPEVLEKAPGHDMSNGVETLKDLQECGVPPMRKLQIKSQKPRKKLIYQDILPSIMLTDLRPQEPGTPNTGVKSSSKRMKTADSQAEFHQAQRERIEARLGRHRLREKSVYREEDVLDSITLSDDEVDTPLPALHRDTNTDDQCVIAQSEPSLPIESEEQPNNLPRRSRENPSSPAAASKHTTITTTSTSDLDLAQMDQILLTRPPKTISPKASHLRPHEGPKPPTNSVSPSSSVSKPSHKPPSAAAAAAAAATATATAAATATASPLIPDNPPNHTPSNPIPPGLHPRPSKPHKRSPMRKTVSEPLDRLPTSAANRAAPDQVPDPWSREAWDLFGHGRPTKGKNEGDG